jgi:ATP-binding cassette subfamily B protein
MASEDEYERNVSDRELAVRLLKYTWKIRRKASLLGIAMVVSTILNLFPPYLFSLAIDDYIATANLNGLFFIVVAFLGVNLASFVTEYARTYLLSWMGGKLEYELRLEIFQYFQRLSLGYFAKKDVGALVSRAMNDIEKIIELVSSGVLSAIADLLTLVGIIWFMILMSPRLTMITFSVVPLILVFAYFWGKKVRKVYKETRRTIASVSAKIEESVSGMREIQSFSRERETRREFNQINVSNMQANVEASRVMSAFMPAVAFFSALGNFLVLWFGGNAVMEGTLTVGVLFAFMSYMTRFFWPIQNLSNFWNQVQSALAAAERVFYILDTEIEVKEKTDSKVIPTSARAGRINFENMDFSYEEGIPVLQDINLTIEPNTTVALVGPTGAGKTTMVNLLYRFYDPKGGRITVGGYDLRDLNIEDYRKQMAIVLQDPFLFTGTVKDNIKYGDQEASDDKVIEVAKAVGAHDFIIKMPDGYDTDVRERGSRLSMGQRQLISLARALIADPRILIMDEATSSIDAYTELIIKQAMEKVLSDRTSIVIAHRLSTVRNADMIVVLDGGKIVEKGNHRTLLRQGGLYKELYEMQFKYEKPEQMTETPDQTPKEQAHQQDTPQSVSTSESHTSSQRTTDGGRADSNNDTNSTH